MVSEMPIFRDKRGRISKREQMEYEVQTAQAMATRKQSEAILEAEKIKSAFKEWEKRFTEPRKKKQAASEVLQRQTMAVQTGMSFVDWLKPMLGIVFIAFLVMGPGLAAVFAIAKSLNMWMWGGIIIMGIIMWRNM